MLPERGSESRAQLPGRRRNRESPTDRSPEECFLALRNDFAVALLALEALSADVSLGMEQRRLVDVGLARQLRAVERLAVRSGRQVAHPQI
jgi:hypothetical protein